MFFGSLEVDFWDVSAGDLLVGSMEFDSDWKLSEKLKLDCKSSKNGRNRQPAKHQNQTLMYCGLHSPQNPNMNTKFTKKIFMMCPQIAAITKTNFLYSYIQTSEWNETFNAIIMFNCRHTFRRKSIQKGSKF